MTFFQDIGINIHRRTIIFIDISNLISYNSQTVSNESQNYHKLWGVKISPADLPSTDPRDILLDYPQGDPGFIILNRRNRLALNAHLLLGTTDYLNKYAKFINDNYGRTIYLPEANLIMRNHPHIMNESLLEKISSFPEDMSGLGKTLGLTIYTMQCHVNGKLDAFVYQHHPELYHTNQAVMHRSIWTRKELLSLEIVQGFKFWYALEMALRATEKINGSNHDPNLLDPSIPQYQRMRLLYQIHSQSDKTFKVEAESLGVLNQRTSKDATIAAFNLDTDVPTLSQLGRLLIDSVINSSPPPLNSTLRSVISISPQEVAEHLY